MKKVTVVYVLLSCSSKWKHEAKLLYTRLSVRLSMCLSVSCPALRMMRFELSLLWNINSSNPMLEVESTSQHGPRGYGKLFVL